MNPEKQIDNLDTKTIYLLIYDNAYNNIFSCSVSF